MVNKTKTATRRARPLNVTPARAENLQRVQRTAFNAGESRAACIAAVFTACGQRPALALADAVRLRYIVGTMASALARKGDNRTDTVLFAHCLDRIEHYANANSTTALRKGQKGRRTANEELAYSSARVQWSGIAKAAGVTLPMKSGSNSTGRKPRPAAKAMKGKPGNDNAKPVIRAYKTAEQFNEYVGIQAAALLGMVNKNAKIASNEMKSLIQDFSASVKKLI